MFFFLLLQIALHPPPPPGLKRIDKSWNFSPFQGKPLAWRSYRANFPLPRFEFLREQVIVTTLLICSSFAFTALSVHRFSNTLRGFRLLITLPCSRYSLTSFLEVNKNSLVNRSFYLDTPDSPNSWSLLSRQNHLCLRCLRSGTTRRITNTLEKKPFASPGVAPP